MRAQRHWFRLGLFCLLVASAPIESSAQAQTFPAGPVKFITAMAAGSGSDPAMRIVADQLGRIWNQQTVLVNQPGAGGALAARAAAAAAPDGHTLFMAIASTFTVLPATQPHLPVNTNNFVPIGFVGEVPLAIAASPALPVNSLSELIALSKSQSGRLNIAVGFRGGIPHLAMELFRTRSGADLTAVYYPGSAQAISDVMAGRVPIIVEGLAGPIAAGQLKLLAIASPTRLASRPEVPTVSETVPRFAASGWFVLVAPPGTPASIAKKVSDDLRVAVGQADVREKFAALGVSTRSMSPQELDGFIHTEQQLWNPVIKQLGLAAN
jgi:tripartite-type tricarboxylate transporter receptor subunit TctC